MIGAEFSNEDFETLSEWLMRRGKGIFDVVELEGFLTAVVIGPNTLSPLTWLPKVWGGREPDFKDLDEMNRFVALVMRFYNSIAVIFEISPGEFAPTFYERQVDGESVIIVDEWCFGFMKGVRLDSAGWKALKRERPELLQPLELFGTRAGLRKLDARGAHRLDSLTIPNSTRRWMSFCAVGNATLNCFASAGVSGTGQATTSETATP